MTSKSNGSLLKYFEDQVKQEQNVPCEVLHLLFSCCLGSKHLQNLFVVALKMDLERITSHITVTSHGTDWRTDKTHTHTHTYPPDVPAGLQTMPLAIFKNGIHQRRSIHPHRGHSTECTRGVIAKPSFFTLQTSITHKFCSDSLPVKMMGETLQSKASFANKILQPLFKIKHKLASLVRQQADSIPLSRASFIYIKFNTVSSSQSDNRVRELN